MPIKKTHQPNFSSEQRRLIREQLAGFKKMNEFVREERRRKLPTLTAERSKDIYECLWSMWEFTRAKYPDYKKVDRLRIRDLIERRRIWDFIAKSLASEYDRPYEAAKEIHDFLTAQHIPYVIISGVAVQRWGDLHRLAKISRR